MIDEYVYEFINNPTELSESDMRAVMKRGQLSEIEQRIVLREVKASREFAWGAACGDVA